MAKRTVNAKEVVNDIRAGMSDTVLMEKYGLPPEWLPIMFSKLTDSGLLAQAELDQRLHTSEWSHIVDTGDLSELEETTRVDEFEKTVDLRELERAELFDEQEKPSLHPPQPKTEPPVQPLAQGQPDTAIASPSQQQLLAEISAGMHYHTLMQKYRLSDEDLRARVTRLVEAGSLTRSELAHWSPLSQPSLLVEADNLKDEPTTTVDLSRFVEKVPQPDGQGSAPHSMRAVPQLDAGLAIPDDVARAINELTRWWSQHQSTVRANRPVLKRTKLVTRSIRVDEDLLKAAQVKAGQEARRTGGDLNSLIELLLWEFLDRDPRFLQ